MLCSIAVAACSQAHGAPSKQQKPGPAPKSTTSTTAARISYGTFPLTGLPVYDRSLAQRPALSVKIDNAAPARPQAGLNAADIVTEELVEGGLTRFFATFQSQDAASVGPVRSARPVDADLLRELNGGLFAFSGAAAGELAPVQQRSTAVLISDERGDNGFHRVADRPAPYNLYVSTPAMYVDGAARAHPTPPPQLFSYAAPTPPGNPTGSVALTFSNRSSSSWAWSSGRYQRTQDGAPATADDGAPLTTDNVVILSVAIQGTGIFDTAHEEDPLVVVTGTGTAWVLRDGVLVQGTWQRPSSDGGVQVLGPDGHPIALHPGRTWLELLPNSQTPAFSA